MKTKGERIYLLELQVRRSKDFTQYLLERLERAEKDIYALESTVRGLSLERTLRTTRWRWQDDADLIEKMNAANSPPPLDDGPAPF